MTACDSFDAPAPSEESERADVEASLARAIENATAAGQWDVVTALARLLAERQRLTAAPDVASLDAARARRGR